MDKQPPTRPVVTPLHGRGTPRRRGRPVPETADARVDGLTVSFQIRSVHGPEADRVAATQTRAITALLHWLANQETISTPVADTAAPVTDIRTWDTDEEQAA